MKKTLLIGLLFLAACGNPKTEVPPPMYFPPVNPAAMPRPVALRDVKTYVVTAGNYEEFVKTSSAANGELVFVAMSTADFQDMAYNLTELRRYISQQKTVIVYYQKSIEDLQKLNTYPTKQ